MITKLLRKLRQRRAQHALTLDRNRRLASYELQDFIRRRSAALKGRARA